MKYALAFIVALFFAIPAQAADPYLIVGGSLANVPDFGVSDLDTDNIGYYGEAGVLFGSGFAIGIEASSHMHLGNETLGAAVNGRYFVGDWALQPYVSAGLGSTFEGVPLAQFGGGIRWLANSEDNGRFSILAGYEQRFYYESFTDFNETGTDGYAKVWLMLTF